MPKLQTVSLVDALATTLRARVLDGLIEPGSGLTENDVAAEYDVSRPTAKTAITMLVQEGLLRREPHKSARVPALSRADVEDLFLVRVPLELGVVALIAEPGPCRPGAARPSPTSGPPCPGRAAERVRRGRPRLPPCPRRRRRQSTAVSGCTPP